MRDESDGVQNKAQLLKELRQRYQNSVARTQALIKEQNEIRRKIREVCTDEAKTVPEIAKASGLPADKVLWYLMALKKYSHVEEQDMDGQYYRYQWKKEKQG